jgi:hypothetical protein
MLIKANSKKAKEAEYLIAISEGIVIGVYRPIK